jgi:Na+-translocating ferredoxin:NAD+ oxidoreductase subunit B
MDKVYYDLRETLDKMPNGFPAEEDGLEIKILKKIFTAEEAGIAIKMKMKFETADAMAARTGLDAEYLTKKLAEMAGKGQISGVKLENVIIYKLLPFVFGIYEFQIKRMDRELVEMVDRYMSGKFGRQFAATAPALMKVVPVEQEIPHGSVVEPYESVSRLIESAKSWAVEECICKKDKRMLGKGCDYPIEVCIAIAPLENFFDDFFWGRPITKSEALKVLKTAEDAGLVHLTSNMKEGQIYICNCCGCCCGMLRGINELGIPDAVSHSNYRAVVDESSCTSCGACLDRCQVRAIEMNETASVKDLCIGCGLCVSACPVEAIKLIARAEHDKTPVPADEKEWVKRRAESRGRSDYKDLL